MRARGTAKCQHHQCSELARWRPVLYVPALNGTFDIVVVPLPLAVCNLHKLPKRGWHGLNAASFHATLRRKYAGRGELLFERAWIAHEWLPLAEA